MKERKFLHDLASPLAGVSLIAETLLADIPEPDANMVRERVEEVLAGMERMKQLLNARREEISHEQE